MLPIAVSVASDCWNKWWNRFHGLPIVRFLWKYPFKIFDWAFVVANIFTCFCNLFEQFSLTVKTIVYWLQLKMFDVETLLCATENNIFIHKWNLFLAKCTTKCRKTLQIHFWVDCCCVCGCSGKIKLTLLCIHFTHVCCLQETKRKKKFNNKNRM